MIEFLVGSLGIILVALLGLFALRSLQSYRRSLFLKHGISIGDPHRKEVERQPFTRVQFAHFESMTYERTLEVAFWETDLYLRFNGEEEVFVIPYSKIRFRQKRSFAQANLLFVVGEESKGLRFGLDHRQNDELKRRIGFDDEGA